jgi:hypothetical protein
MSAEIQFYEDKLDNDFMLSYVSLLPVFVSVGGSFITPSYQEFRHSGELWP